MKQLGLMIDIDRCNGCKTCIVACRNHHGIVDYETCMPNQIPYYIRVESKTEGMYPLVSESSWVVPCQHCSDPGCVAACPQEAVTKNPQNGVVTIDPEKCNGCEFKEEISAQDKTKPAPCSIHCPAELNVQGYVQMVKQGRYQDAVELILRRVPLPGVLGRICPHPCEDNCRRAEADEAVSIRELKRVAADMVDFDQLPIPKIEENGKKAAVIGSGPAGLTVAYELRKKGCQVTIFEAQDKLGGMLRAGIPDYRLPSEVLDREINFLLKHGIEVRTGVRFGEDVTVQDLTAEGFGAVFLGIGLQGGVSLNVPGQEADGVLDALEFLKKVNLGSGNSIGSQVVVVGGGNVAIDAARTARRLGCPKVTVVYRRGQDEMPAYPEEVTGAGEESIEFVYLASPVEVVQDGGKVTGLKCIKNELGLPDASGRPRPVPVSGSEFVVECDTVISAIGQSLDAPWAVGSSGLSGGNLIQASQTMQTIIPNVFAAGDAVRGPSSVIEAIADGHKAAASMFAYLQGIPLDTCIQSGNGLDAKAAITWKAVPPGVCEKATRARTDHMDPGERAECFLEECRGLTEEQAKAEAERCLNCGCCCMQSCPYDVIQFDAEKINAHKCTLCSDLVVFGDKPVCADVCMVDAICFGEVDLLKEEAISAQREIDPTLSTESVLYLKPKPKNTLATM